ncbi:MAG: PD-(D/E)XK nuclease family protein [Pseudomonadota bacterium]|nr:PD-(D/E)XK nuclease family protein [Pseudomonadota bacterium]
MADLINELVWSHSRSRTFAACPRAYWYTYYGSWGGWSRDVPAPIRDAYVQKKLTTRAMWIGTVVHGAAEEGIRRIVGQRPLDLEAAVRTTLTRARNDIEGSRTGDWLQRAAKRTGFREHYYGEPVDPSAWEAAIAEIERQVRGLYENRIFRRIGQVPGRVMEVEELRRFRVGSTEVYAALDVLMADGNGGVVIIDWKTGEAHSNDEIAAQLGVYGIYATQELGVPTDRVKAMHVNLRHAVETTHAVGPAAIEAAREEIEAGVTQMREKLRDVPGNVAEREDYPMVPEGDSRCRWCSFRRSCARET